MDEFQDDAEIDVFIGQTSGGSAGQDGEGGADSLATGVADIFHVGFHARIKFADLLPIAGFNLFDMGPDEVEGK